VDVRFVFASNRDLEESVNLAAFREDLYHRINLLSVRLPPLRERREDIPLLAQFFLDTYPYRAPGDWVLAPETMAALLAHPWPGNIRELRNAMRRACILATGNQITPDLLPFRPPPAVARDRGGAGEPVPPLWEVERDHIRRALAATQGNKTRAAHVLEIDRKTLNAKIQRYGLAT
jgi:DNA-binding NtrC family response regulator